MDRNLSTDMCFSGGLISSPSSHLSTSSSMPLPPPFPFGFPPPPPPLEESASSSLTAKDLPYGMKPKKKYELDIPLKHAHWKKILPQEMSETAFWVYVDEEKFADNEILERLSAKFSSKPQAKKENEKQKFKKVKELKVLEAKSAQSLLILLRSVQKISAQDIQQCILRIDEENLTDVILQQLIKYMPDPDQLQILEQYKDQYNELNEAEQFVITMGSIKELVPRLKSIYFKKRFKELVQDIEPGIDAATAAFKEVKHSKKFSVILQMILLIGNYMNTGSMNGQAFGFEINFLTKLNFTKSVDLKTTLLHFIVEVIEKKYPDALNLPEELRNIDKAAKVSYKQIQENLTHMKNSVKELETHLKSFSPHNEEDRFGDVMTGFLNEAAKKHTILEEKFIGTRKLFKDISVYYAFDPKKYTSDEFFSDIKTFKDMFQEAYKDNLRARELEIKMNKARETKEKAQKEKQEKLDKKKQPVDRCSVVVDEDQEGIMDSLFALKIDQTFTHNPQRKARTRDVARRTQLNRSRSRCNILSQHNGGKEIVHMDSRNAEVAR